MPPSTSVRSHARIGLASDWPSEEDGTVARASLSSCLATGEGDLWLWWLIASGTGENHGQRLGPLPCRLRRGRELAGEAVQSCNGSLSSCCGVLTDGEQACEVPSQPGKPQRDAV